MNRILYAVVMLISLILAPIVGLVAAFLTFFTAIYSFISGFHGAMIEHLHPQKNSKPTEKNDIWTNHIQRMENNKK